MTNDISSQAISTNQGFTCSLTDQLTFRGSSSLQFSANTKVSFNLPVNLMDLSTVLIDEFSYVELSSGGMCGNDVKMVMGKNATYALNGGSFNMGSTCSLTGALDSI